MEVRQWDEAMGEISGFGVETSYEQGCRAMVLAGIAWLDEHPDANPVFKGYENIYGIINEANADAEALTKAIMDATVEVNGKTVRCGDEATGAMHHATVSHCLAYRRLGWEAYRETLIEREKKERP